MNKLLLSLLILCSFQLSTMANAAEENDKTVNAELKKTLTNKVLTAKEIESRAEKSGYLYLYCISNTAEKLKSMYPDSSESLVLSTINDSCQYPEDLYSIYNIVLAHQNMNKKVSEQDALSYLEKAYKAKGRDETNKEQRLKLFKALEITTE
jgi:hypothetical protein